VTAKMTTTKLHNCLVEMLVAVGMDRDSGLHPLNEPAVRFYFHFSPQLL
jgi:hypothetical protein